MEITSKVNFVLKNPNSTVIELISGQQAIHELQENGQLNSKFQFFQSIIDILFYG